MSRKPAWKSVKRKTSKAGTYVGVFVVLVLLGFLVYGYLRDLNLKPEKKLESGVRKSGNTYIAALGSKPSALFAFQKDTGKAAIFVLDDEKRVPSGEGAQNLVKIGDLVSAGDGQVFLNAITLAFRAKISNFVLFKNTHAVDAESLRQDIDKFTSLWTPIAILISGVDRGNVKDINITRFEAIRLWWQLKNIRAENIKITDLTVNGIEKTAIDAKKVLGVDESFLNRSIQPLTESDEVIAEHLKVVIKNPGKNRIVSQLAAGFANNTGADLREVSEDGVVMPKTLIYTDQTDSKTAHELATVFNCDIKRQSGTQDINTITVVIGSDFGETYLK